MEGRLIMFKKLIFFLLITSIAFGQWNYDWSTTPMTAKILANLEPTGNVAIGSTVDPDMGLIIGTAQTVTATENGLGVYVNPTFTEATSGTHTTMAGVYVNGFTVTDDATATSTNIASIYVAGAPTGATATNGNKAIQVASGDSYFGGDIAVVGDFNADSVTIDSATDIGGTLTLSKGSQDYLFADNGDGLAIQSQTSGTQSILGLYAKDGDATDRVNLILYGKGTPSDITNREGMNLRYDIISTAYEIFTEADGSGTLRPLVLYTEGNANQLYLATGGQNIMGHNASIAINDHVSGLDVNAWFQVHQNGVASAEVVSWSTSDERAGRLVLGHAPSGTIGTYALASDDMVLGSIEYVGSDASNLNTSGAGIVARIDGTPAANRMPTDLEFYTALGGADDDIALSATIGKDAMLDLYGGTISILAGANDGAKTRTDATTKVMRFGMPHRDLAEEPTAVAFGITSTGSNELSLGGGSGTMNAVTALKMFAADDNTTTTGTEVARFEGGAAKATMMGLGNSSLEAWNAATSALQVKTTGVLWSIDQTVDNMNIGSNIYYDGANKAIIDSEASRIRLTNDGGIDLITYAAPAAFVGDGSASDALGTATTILALGSDASATFGGDVTADKSGTNVNSPFISLKGDQAGTEQEAQIQLIYGDNEYLRISVDNSAEALTPVMDIRSDLISFFNGAAGVDYYFTFNGETNDGTITYMEDEDRFDFDNDVQIDGDLTVTGSISGGAYGEAYIANPVGETLSYALQDTWYEIDTLTVGDTSQVTISTGANNRLAVQQAGTYQVSWYLSTSASAANKTFSIGVGVNGSNPDQSAIIQRRYSVTDVGSTSGSVIVTLTAGQYVNIMSRNDSDNTTDLTLNFGNIQIHKI